VTTANGNGNSLEKADGYTDAQISIKGLDNSLLEDAVSFKVRGNSTAMVGISKKAFTFKFSYKKDVLGMGKGKKWALIANAFDPTLLRNYMALSLAKKLGLAYTSEFRFAELWVDGVFRGCYLLAEPVQEGKDRVNIDVESNEGKNDFLIEYEASRQEDGVTYFTVQNLRFISSEPEEPDEAQLDYIKSTMDAVLSAVRRGNPEEIAQKIDVASFA
jgi:spore coat protein CotH